MSPHREALGQHYGYSDAIGIGQWGCIYGERGSGTFGLCEVRPLHAIARAKSLGALIRQVMLAGSQCNRSRQAFFENSRRLPLRGVQASCGTRGYIKLYQQSRQTAQRAIASPRLGEGVARGLRGLESLSSLDSKVNFLIFMYV